MSGDETPLVVTSSWLAAERGQDSAVRVLDGSWHLPSAGTRPGHRVPGSAYSGRCLLRHRRHLRSLTRRCPTCCRRWSFSRRASRRWASAMTPHVVVYDTVGLYSAARVWWMFRVFGHERISILAGGLPRWQAEGHPVESGEPAIAPGSFTAQGSRRHVGPVLRAGPRDPRYGRRTDRRCPRRPPASRARIRGQGPTFRAATFPVAATSPSTRFSDDDDTTLGDHCGNPTCRSPTPASTPAQPVIATCGSGITACALALALAAIGAEEVAVYDGSWSDWGSRADAPVESGGPA